MNEEAALFIGSVTEPVEECPFKGTADLLNQPTEFYYIPNEEFEDA